MKLQHKQQLVQKRRWHIRKRVQGTAERPRLSLRLSNKHIYAQCIDDLSGKTLVSLTSTSKEVRDAKLKANLAGASELGKRFGEKAKAAGISAVVFDRNGRRYHGTVQAFADAVREAGLQF